MRINPSNFKGRLPSSADKKLDNEKKTIDIDSNSVILNILEMGKLYIYIFHTMTKDRGLILAGIFRLNVRHRRSA
jgi:hypothetical protein